MTVEQELREIKQELKDFRKDMDKQLENIMGLIVAIKEGEI